MKKRRADSLVEILIAFLIIIIAISISVLASSQVNQLKKQAVIKTHIYDLAYSYAEEQLATSTLLFSDTGYSKDHIIDDNDFLLTFTVETSPTTITNFFGQDITAATLTVKLKDEADKYKIQLLVIPQQP